MATAIKRQKHPGRFAYLMGLYAQHYWQLVSLFGPERLREGRYVSSIGDGLDVELVLLECHRYTQVMRLSYLFKDEPAHPEPSAYVRIYQDAQLAEVCNFHVDSRLRHVLGGEDQAHTQFERSLQLNIFLGKWLDYLQTQGHSRFSLNGGCRSV